MENELDFLPQIFFSIKKNFKTDVRFSLVSDLELEEAIFVQDGNHGEYRPLQNEFVERGVPFVRPGNLLNGRVDLSSCDQINETAFRRIRKGIGKANDIILTSNATIGRLAIIDRFAPTFVSNPQTTIWRSLDPERIEQKYLYYFMLSSGFQDQLEAHKGRNATFDYVSLTKQRSLTIPLPPLHEQKAIAHILGSLDDKIELNRRMNATLERMAQALFKSWFVDFDPVVDNALVAGNPIPDELAERAEVRRKALADGTANREAAKQFPAAFQLTEEMGWIPEGWEVGKISDIAKLNPESWSNRSHPEHVKYVDLANTKNGQINEVFQYDYSDAPSRARRVLRKDDTIIGMVRPGNRSFAYIHEDGLTGSTGFAVIRAKRTSTRIFIYLCLTQDEAIENFAHLADGGAYPAIRPEVVGNRETVLFDSDLMGFFDQQCYPLISKIGKHQQESETLSNLRDTLLPKLISGELRIHEAESLVEEALA